MKKQFIFFILAIFSQQSLSLANSAGLQKMYDRQKEELERTQKCLSSYLPMISDETSERGKPATQHSTNCFAPSTNALVNSFKRYMNSNLDYGFDKLLTYSKLKFED